MTASTALTQDWKTAVLTYAAYLNAYIARGDARGWKGMGDPKPAPDLQALWPQLLTELRAANAEGSDAAIAAFRAHWPPLYEAALPMLDDNGQGFAALAWLPDGAWMVRTGAWYQPGQVMVIRGLQVSALPQVEMFGLSPGQRILALAAGGQVKLVDSADLTLRAQFGLPAGNEGLPPGFPAASEDAGERDESHGDEATLTLQQLIPFDDARGVIVVQSAGVFLVRSSGVQRLLPTAEDLRQRVAEGELYPVRLDMCHAALSPDGQWIVCGAQDGRHHVFNAQGELIDHIGPHGEYPHHAAFFADGRHVAFNACHMYNGGTIAVDVDALGGIDTDFYEDHPAVTLIDTSARVYASAPTGDALVLGDAHGYLWVRSPSGELRWKQHVGSTVSAMAVSADGQQLAVGTHSGTVHLIDLGNEEPAPEQVGLRARRELRRWLFWKQEDHPLAW